MKYTLRLSICLSFVQEGPLSEARMAHEPGGALKNFSHVPRRLRMVQSLSYPVVHTFSVCQILWMTSSVAECHLELYPLPSYFLFQRSTSLQLVTRNLPTTSFSEGFLLFIARSTEKDNNKQHFFMINQGPSQDLQCMATSSRHFEKPSQNFAEKLVLKLVASFSSHCLAYELNLTRRLFKGRVVHSVQLQMQIENIIFKSWGMHRKHEMVSWF